MRDSTVVYLAIVAGLLLAWLVDSLLHRRRMRDPNYRRMWEEMVENDRRRPW